MCASASAARTSAPLSLVSLRCSRFSVLAGRLYAADIAGDVESGWAILAVFDAELQHVAARLAEERRGGHGLRNLEWRIAAAIPDVGRRIEAVAVQQNIERVVRE